MLHLLVAFKFELAKQVEACHSKDYNPQRQVNLAVEQTPSPVLVGHREELEAEGQFEEGEDNLHRVEPAARLHILQHRREERQESERQREANAEAEHRHQSDPAVGGGGGELDKGGADDGASAGE